MSSAVMHWHGADHLAADDRRFVTLLVAIGLPVLALAIMLGLMKLAPREVKEDIYIPPAAVELLPIEALEEEPAAVPEVGPEEQPKPAEQDIPKPVEKPQAKPVEKPQAKPTPVPDAKPVVDPTVQAREVAKNSGVLAFSDQLADMRNRGDVTGNQSLNPNVLSSSGAAGAAGAANGGDAGAGALAGAASANSGGIGSKGSAGVSSTQSAQGTGERRASKVQSTLAAKGSGGKKEGDNLSKGRGGRSQEEIQLVFDRAQGSFYAMYLRALRENAALVGKVIISVTIAPDGSVKSANVVSSELGDPELESKIITRVRSLNFGAKEVGDFTYPNYRITFKPPT